MPIQSNSRKWIVTLAGTCLISGLSAQDLNPTQRHTSRPKDGDSVPVYQVNVVSRTVRAINYHHRQGSTPIDFRGTELMPAAEGEARVESRTGSTKIDAYFRRLGPAQQFGPEFLTYVLWAITPEGRAQNLGEVVLDNQHSRLLATTELQSFGLIVTAEPYFAVTQPSDVVVMQNFIRDDTTGTFEYVDANYELLRRGTYVRTVDHRAGMQADVAANTSLPLSLREAYNALAIARTTGADTYAADSLRKALVGYDNARGFYASGAEKRMQTVAREATQFAEDARLISLRRKEANHDARLKADVEQARLDAEEAHRMREEALRQKLAAQDRADAERNRNNRTASEGRISNVYPAGDTPRVELSELQRQWSGLLNVRHTDHSLVLTVPDSCFERGGYTLTPDATQKLARAARELANHPDLMVEVNGYLDNGGGWQTRQALSLNRAEILRAFLILHGVDPVAVSAYGFGDSNPVASNTTPEGRQQNRRVEIVVSPSHSEVSSVR